jgi:heme-degrading monooxygenase HmoA
MVPAVALEKEAVMTEGREVGADALYRIDKFIVPAAARTAFLERVAATSRVLHEQKGFRRELVLEQSSGPGAFNFVTVVEWEDGAAVEPAASAVARAHAEQGFDRQAFLAENGIRADIACYSVVAL